MDDDITCFNKLHSRCAQEMRFTWKLFFGNPIIIPKVQVFWFHLYCIAKLLKIPPKALPIECRRITLM